jgi:hypothetical protein
MSRQRTQGRVRRQVQHLLQCNDGAAVCQLLSKEQVRAAVEAEGYCFRQCLFTPLVVLWTFLLQVLSPDGSCREAVSKLLALLAGLGEDAALEPDTGPYCKARKKLPEALLARLMRESGRQLHAGDRAGRAGGPSRSRLLGGRPIKIVDGTTASMPDTPENQAEYPQPTNQKPGLGFPLVRLVVVLSLDCAAVLDVAKGPYAGKQTGEPALFRSLWQSLEAGDPGAPGLADRYYASYWTIAGLLQRGVDSLFRQFHRRKIDFRQGTKLGKEDHVITLPKPRQPREWMDAENYRQMPAELTVREVRVRVEQRRFRVKTLVLVTTLLEAEVYSRRELAEVFRLRWHAELDLRSIKQTMNLSVLRCKSPEMIRKEIWMHLLAYNLVRTLMALAAERADLEPRKISFAGAVQTINAMAPLLWGADRARVSHLVDVMLYAISRHRVGDRPDRVEPRAVKRRAKPIAWLTEPRDQARRRLEGPVHTKG